jgi:Plasmid pRiA4b ORF-3-like protein
VLADAAAARRPDPCPQAGPTVRAPAEGHAGRNPAPVWRRIEVPSTVTLQQLHQDIQHAFGWYGGHLWVFSTPLCEFGTADPEPGHRSAASKTLADVAGARGDRIDYTYDFGDDWVHRIVVDDVGPADPDVAYPRCLTGRRATPPKDCGGAWGYADLLEILADPEHPEHAETLDWLGLESGEEFDPARFDITEVNKALSRRC